MPRFAAPLPQVHVSASMLLRSAALKTLHTQTYTHTLCSSFSRLLRLRPSAPGPLASMGQKKSHGAKSAPQAQAKPALSGTNSFSALAEASEELLQEAESRQTAAAAASTSTEPPNGGKKLHYPLVWVDLEMTGERRRPMLGLADACMHACKHAFGYMGDMRATVPLCTCRA
jgi:hypothetical protein